MIKRSLSVSKEEAVEWYGSGNSYLKELALRVYTENELNRDRWKSIKTIEKAIVVAGIEIDDALKLIGTMNDKRLISLYYLDIIRKAFCPNGQYDDFGKVRWYPSLRFSKRGTPEATRNIDPHKVIGRFTYGDGVYDVVCDVRRYEMCNPYCGLDAQLTLDNLLLCETKEIAERICELFGHYIFYACYGDTFGNNFVTDNRTLW
jgi:hypothetical protein